MSEHEPKPAKVSHVVVQCHCGRTLELRPNEVVECPACGCRIAERELLPRLEFPPE